jgi:hypothetical protein
MIIYTERSVFSSHLKNLLLTILIIFASSSFLSGQNRKEESPALKDRLFYGGNFSLQFGAITNIEVAPLIGLWVLPRIAVAAGPSYRYYKDWNGKTNIIGGRSYMQLVIFRDIDKLIPFGASTNIFLHCEDEMLSLQSEFWQNVTLSPKRFIINTVLAGGGISRQLGARSAVNFMLLWALNDSGYDLYNSPEIRIGFVF